MPVPVLVWLAVLLASSQIVDEILQSVGGLPKNLMKEGPEEAKRSPLEFIAAAVKEE